MPQEIELSLWPHVMQLPILVMESIISMLKQINTEHFAMLPIIYIVGVTSGGEYQFA